MIHPTGVFLSFVISLYTLDVMRNMANNAERSNPKPRWFGILERSESIVLVVDTQFNLSLPQLFYPLRRLIFPYIMSSLRST